ncbi:cyclic nucleotide-binding domain-containing protein [Rhodocaloribacter litoris]|uniref:cyclic nucleotide-binding domain-containing protein n=1 Tax=Rhodocaloribacter litoris TaxID=2558931 RepID=UPI001423C556|nr:cyclic nucleotide-binding domain-containing protein [Rhodocaloribacter litoris]QXD13977.1 cyclic nucleotide-binding domain-containing protein [Rhodocaloribacter litoris]
MPTLHNVFSTLRGLHRRLLRREEDARLRRIVDTLRETTAFRALARRDLWALAEAVHPRHYHPDEYFYYENDPGLGLYVVQRGRVRLLVEDGDGGLQEVRQVGEHELFGESALFGTAELRRTETAQAVTETDVLGFFSPDLKTLQRRNPRAAAAVTGALARHLALRQVALLHRLSERDGKVVTMRLFHETGASAVGLPPYTARR